ncbi:efflux RND transporter periplasmic adaptor subunit [Solitalea lacus]|uniref:efflux RND transporter periplasmic adaptor subunit n=1 Tax=Solitalea lacus TaxID=2911172 RepID=UPI001EDA8A5D|nr:efflux RND transporter periplasmic adaptor subunit [Solitalea lacus]UKJ06594.1 efflux RND transporter periplasmic adaptor subunit [Solitalea lacus]
MKTIIQYTILFAAFIVFISSCKNNTTREHSEHQASKEEAIYTCSMHPEILRNEPGDCPVCGMQLIKKETTGRQTVNDVKLESLLKPTNEFVVSTIPKITIEKREREIEIESIGKIDYNTNEVGTISAKISGRIEKMYVHYRYQKVYKGQKIFDIYSPELLTAQQNLLFLLKNDANNISLINAAKEKLFLLGMSRQQLQQLMQTQKSSFVISVYSNYSGHIHEAAATRSIGMNPTAPEGMKDVSLITSELPLKEGMYVTKGQNIFTVFNPAKAWALLSIYAEQQGLVQVDNPVRVIPETAPDKSFRATIDFIEPFYRKDSKTLTARVNFNNESLQIPVGSQVKAVIFGNTKEAYWLPKNAVVSLGLDKVAFLKENGGFRAHKIITGITHDNHIQVISGLSPQDSVAINAQYLMDSESFIKVNE